MSTISLPSGALKSPKAGTMRHSIISLMAREGGVTSDELFKKYPKWNKRHITECVRILKKTYGYNVLSKQNGDTTTFTLGEVANVKIVSAPAVAGVSSGEPVGGSEEGGEDGGSESDEGGEQGDAQPVDQTDAPPAKPESNRARKRRLALEAAASGQQQN